MAKKSVPVIEVAPRIALLSDDLLPSIKAPASARNKVRFDPNVLDNDTSGSIGRARSNSVDPSDPSSANRTLNEVKGSKLDRITNIIPMSSAANGFIDGKQEIEKAYQMLRFLRKENEEYQKELILEKEKNFNVELQLKEKEIERNQLLEEKKSLAHSLEIAMKRTKELELSLLDERRRGAEKLESLLRKEKALETELKNTVSNTANFSRQLNTLINRISFSMSSKIPTDEERIEEMAPMGRVALVFTDVENSTEKWETNPEVMQQCLMLHNNLIREKIRELEGYEVKTEGDSFMVAFWSTVNALKFCLALQIGLLDVEWPKEIEEWPDCREIRSDTGVKLWHGLRLPTCSVDPVTGRMDYLGSTVNKTSRIASMAAGGQILISAEAQQEIGNFDGIITSELGSFSLKGISDKTMLIQVLPSQLHERLYPPTSSNNHHVTLEKQLQNLVKENDRLKTHLNELETELNNLAVYSTELEKKYSKIHLKRELSAQSLNELLQAVVWNDALSGQVSSLQAKIGEFHGDTVKLKKQLTEVIHQKDQLVQERDKLMLKLQKSELELLRLRDQITQTSEERKSVSTEPKDEQPKTPPPPPPEVIKKSPRKVENSKKETKEKKLVRVKSERSPRIQHKQDEDSRMFFKRNILVPMQPEFKLKKHETPKKKEVKAPSVKIFNFEQLEEAKSPYHPTTHRTQTSPNETTSLKSHSPRGS